VNQLDSSIHYPIACLSVSGAVYRLYGAVISRSSDLQSPLRPSQKPITG
jgi:hypothetical protein